ncbi:MAG: flagellar filament outer layer protein FlaA [Spirochaetia bacterium]
MKQLFNFGIVMFFIASVAFAETSVLIDFNDLIDDGGGQNAATAMDFGGEAPASVSAEERAEMKTSLFIANWRVSYNHSARAILNERLTKITPVVSNELGKTVMGIRLVYPQGPNNANATVMPPFSIPSNAPADGAEAGTAGSMGKFNGKGVIKNVGSMKSISLNVRGLDFPHTLNLVIQDPEGKIREIPMGRLDFQGWKTLTWTNPNYVYDVRNLTLGKMPMYPFTVPVIRLVGFKFYRNGGSIGGDFIAYISDVTVTYDKSVDDTAAVDIDDEAVWGILTAREQTRYRLEMQRFGERQVLEFEKKKLQDQSTPNTYPADGIIANPSRRNSNEPAAPAPAGQ